MIENKKVIGICMTKVHEFTQTKALSSIYDRAKYYGFKLMVFNSPFDFFHDVEEDKGAEEVYDFINFGIIDALVIMCCGFSDKEVCKRIADKALKHNVPVILEDLEYDGCITIENDSTETFEALMNHVIRDHGARDTFFVAGFPNNEYSEMRIETYKRVLSENGLAFSEDMVGYGCFWEKPASDVIEDLLKSGRKLPQAIFCANDVMAFAVCETLKKHNITVPDDVIVTGFDGTKSALLYNPGISTCVQDVDSFARICFRVLNDTMNGDEVKNYYANKFYLKLNGSCGCTADHETDFRYEAAEDYRHIREMAGHEEYIFKQIVSLMDYDRMDTNAVYGSISEILGYESLLALKPSFLTMAMKNGSSIQATDEELLSITSKGVFARDVKRRKKFKTSDMIPEIEKWAEDETVYIISPVLVGNVICGFHECQTKNIDRDAQKISRILNMVIMIIHIGVSTLRRRFLRISGDSNTVIDSLTGLPNLHGATHWFEKFAGKQKNRSNPVSLSVYQLPKYKYIYENYGLGEVDSLVCFVAEALRIANPSDCFIARSSEDSFVVINYYDNRENIGPTINNSTTVFYGMIKKYDQNGGKSYTIEVNAGCTVCDSLCNEKLETLIQTATNELYNNKAIYGSGVAEKEGLTTSKEQYELFNALISKNLFCYNFQPIVCADTGEIYAYEALMRTDRSIGLYPLDVLSIATEYKRLYDVEKATLFNVMDRYKNDNGAFRGRKVFINCIPGYFLNEQDNRKLCDEYSSYISNFVFELTEQDTVTEKELNDIRSIGNAGGTNPIAVDDYGTGHSNIVNLINYAPEIVKIDRFLMTDIYKDKTKQLFVNNVIEFARMHNIKVLAEGIETEEELRMVIEMGVDYIQGYYTGKPSYDPAPEIDSKAKAAIISAAKHREDLRNTDTSAVQISDDDKNELVKLIGKLKEKGISSEQMYEIICGTSLQ